MENNKTQENLMSAFAGESQEIESMKLMQKRQSLKERKTRLSCLELQLTCRNDSRVKKEYELAGKVGSTLENLQDGIKGETYENEVMYPDFIKDAEEEDNKKAVQSYLLL